MRLRDLFQPVTETTAAEKAERVRKAQTRKADAARTLQDRMQTAREGKPADRADREAKARLRYADTMRSADGAVRKALATPVSNKSRTRASPSRLLSAAPEGTGNRTI